MYVPAVIGKAGIHEIIELELDDAEKSVFDAGVTNVKNAIKSMRLQIYHFKIGNVIWAFK